MGGRLDDSQKPSLSQPCEHGVGRPADFLFLLPGDVSAGGGDGRGKPVAPYLLALPADGGGVWAGRGPRLLYPGDVWLLPAEKQTGGDLQGPVGKRRPCPGGDGLFLSAAHHRFSPVGGGVLLVLLQPAGGSKALRWLGGPAVLPKPGLQPEACGGFGERALGKAVPPGYTAESPVGDYR